MQSFAESLPEIFDFGKTLHGVKPLSDNEPILKFDLKLLVCDFPSDANKSTSNIIQLPRSRPRNLRSYAGHYNNNNNYYYYCDYDNDNDDYFFIRISNAYNHTWASR